MVEMPEAASSHSTTLDTSNIPLGERSWRAILQHVLEVGDEAETSYLEVKSTLDIKVSQGKVRISRQAITKTAKFLLGMANRQPKDALRHFQGYAVLVIGAEKGNTQGIPRGIEAHDLENALSPYLGSQFPNFELGRLPVNESKEVLFVISSPPEEGQSIYPCLKNYQSDRKSDNLRDGAIYVRAASSTREAQSGEILALVERAQGRRKPQIDLEVSISGPIYRVNHINEVLNSLYNFEEEDFDEKISKQIRQESAPTPLLQVSSPTFLSPPTSSDMKEALGSWRDKRSEYMASGRRYLLGASLEFSRIQVISHSRFIARPHLSIEFQGCEILEWEDPDSVSWGRVVEPIMRQTNIFGNRFTTADFSVYTPHTEPSFGNESNNAWMTCEAESFRPDTPWYSKSEACIFLARDVSSQNIEVTWRLTEDNNDEVTTGSFMVATEPLVAAENLVRRLFFSEE